MPRRYLALPTSSQYVEGKIDSARTSSLTVTVPTAPTTGSDIPLVCAQPGSLRTAVSVPRRGWDGALKMRLRQLDRQIDGRAAAAGSDPFGEYTRRADLRTPIMTEPLPDERVQRGTPGRPGDEVGPQPQRSGYAIDAIRVGGTLSKRPSEPTTASTRIWLSGSDP